MRISDWSSDVCSSDLGATLDRPKHAALPNQDASPSFSPTVTSGIRPQLSASGGRHIPIRTGARSDNLLSLPRHDKAAGRAGGLLSEGGRSGTGSAYSRDRKRGVEGKRVAALRDLGGRRIIKQKYKLHP